MTVKFNSGEVLYVLDMEEWDKPQVKAFAQVMDQFGSAKDLRFPCMVDGDPQFVYAQVDKIDFISFTQKEIQLMEEALIPPIPAEPNREV